MAEDYLGFHCADSRNLSFIPDGVADMVITSCPYNAGINYDVWNDSLPLNEFLDVTLQVWKESYRVLKEGGRVAVNIAGLYRKPYLAMQDLIAEQLREVGFMQRGEIIWNKGGASERGSTAWGSWLSASNPSLRDVHEYILLFSKGRFEKGYKGEMDLTPQEFMDWTISVWDINPTSATSVGHPAPFPAEIPERLIRLYTYKNDVVLDPFMGSGTTCQAAELWNRRWIGVDISQNYVKLAKTNMNTTQRRFNLNMPQASGEE